MNIMEGLYLVIDNLDDWKNLLSEEKIEELVKKGKIIFTYQSLLGYISERSSHASYVTLVGAMEKGGDYRERLERKLRSVSIGYFTDSALTNLILYKLVNDARHVLEGTAGGGELGSKLGVAVPDVYKQKWAELMNDPELLETVGEFFRLIDQYDAQITQAVEQALLLKGILEQPLPPASLHQTTLYREGVRKAIEYLEEVMDYARHVDEGSSPEGGEDRRRRVAIFMAFAGEGPSPLRVIEFDFVPHVFEEAKKLARVAAQALEKYIVENFNPQILGEKYMVTIKIGDVGGEELIDRIELPKYSQVLREAT